MSAINGKPTERGIYAWIAEGSSALVHVHTRPTEHSPGNVLNGSLIRNCQFYDGCAIEQWSGGTWFGPLKHPAAAPVAPAAVATRDTRFTHPGCECCACPPAVCQAEAAPQQVAENAQEVARGDQFEVAASLIANSLLGQAAKEDVQEVEAILRERFPVVTAQPDERAAFYKWWMDGSYGRRMCDIYEASDVTEDDAFAIYREGWQAHAASQATVKDDEYGEGWHDGVRSEQADQKARAAAPQAGVMLTDEQKRALGSAIAALERNGWTDPAVTLRALLAAAQEGNRPPIAGDQKGGNA